MCRIHPSEDSGSGSHGPGKCHCDRNAVPPLRAYWVVKFEIEYGPLDRLLHRIAFASPGLQIALADIEENFFRNQLGADAERPVFIAGLPRAGTTVLLNLLVSSGQFASHTYRDMPFLLCPVLWYSFSSRFRRDEVIRERAHGDGLQVSSDSPEAFEEMIWKYFWPKHYSDDRIEPWSTCNDVDFLTFMRCHMKKIVALRGEERDSKLRYLSKNNQNLARLACLPALAPGSKVIVPFREPLQHALSLLRQHTRFLEMHDDDKFARDYMRAIGHFDFGRNMKPIDFGRWLDTSSCLDPLRLEYWIEYWIAAYRSVITNVGSSVRLLSYRRLTAEPRRVLEDVATFLQMGRSATLVDLWETVSAPKPHETGIEIDSALLARATELYAELESLAR